MVEPALEATLLPIYDIFFFFFFLPSNKVENHEIWFQTTWFTVKYTHFSSHLNLFDLPPEEGAERRMISTFVGYSPAARAYVIVHNREMDWWFKTTNFCLWTGRKKMPSYGLLDESLRWFRHSNVRCSGRHTRFPLEHPPYFRLAWQLRVSEMKNIVSTNIITIHFLYYLLKIGLENRTLCSKKRFAGGFKIFISIGTKETLVVDRKSTWKYHGFWPADWNCIPTDLSRSTWATVYKGRWLQHHFVNSICCCCFVRPETSSEWLGRILCRRQMYSAVM